MQDIALKWNWKPTWEAASAMDVCSHVIQGGASGTGIINLSSFSSGFSSHFFTMELAPTSQCCPHFLKVYWKLFVATCEIAFPPLPQAPPCECAIVVGELTIVIRRSVLLCVYP